MNVRLSFPPCAVGTVDMCYNILVCIIYWYRQHRISGVKEAIHFFFGPLGPSDVYNFSEVAHPARRNIHPWLSIFPRDAEQIRRILVLHNTDNISGNDCFHFWENVTCILHGTCTVLSCPSYSQVAGKYFCVINSAKLLYCIVIILLRCTTVGVPNLQREKNNEGENWGGEKYEIL